MNNDCTARKQASKEFCTILTCPLGSKEFGHYEKHKINADWNLNIYMEFRFDHTNSETENPTEYYFKDMVGFQALTCQIEYFFGSAFLAISNEHLRVFY